LGKVSKTTANFDFPSHFDTVFEKFYKRGYFSEHLTCPH
jgi:hypothetical protein